MGRDWRSLWCSAKEGVGDSTVNTITFSLLQKNKGQYVTLPINCDNLAASTRRQLFPDYNSVWGGGKKKIKLMLSFYDNSGILSVSDFQRVKTGCRSHLSRGT